MNFDNIERRRYYGLRIGDTVEISTFGMTNKKIAMVVKYAFMDNNRVIIRLEDGEETDWVAEYCKVITKVEDKEFGEFVTKKVQKCSINKRKENNKPFKSGNIINTVKGIINHPSLNVPAFIFYEDNSYVECRRCKLAE